MFFVILSRDPLSLIIKFIMLIMKKFEYLVKIVKPPLLNSELSIEGNRGYKLFHVQPINTITGVDLKGFPKQELTYQLIFEKELEK